MKIAKGLRVRLKVELGVEGGDIIEKSVVEYIQGGGTMLPGLESVLEGLEAGTKKKGVIESSRAFGSPQHQPTKTIDRSEFPKDAKLEVGERFGAKGPGGEDVILEVLKNDGKKVDVRFVHALADKDIRFDVEILAVSDPKPPPLPAQAIAESED